jgi:hypothetical protein
MVAPDAFLQGAPMTIETFFRPILYSVSLGFLGLGAYFLVLNNDGSTSAFVVGVTVLLLTRLSEIEKFDFGLAGVKAEMRKAVDDAKASVAQLHDLAEVVSSMLVREIVSSGRWGGITPIKQRDMVDELIAGLRKTGLASERIEKIVALKEPWDHFDYAHWVWREADRLLPPEREQLRRDFTEPLLNKGLGYEPDAEAFATFVASAGLKSPELQQRLEDFRHYEQQKTHRRPTAWYNRYEPTQTTAVKTPASG